MYTVTITNQGQMTIPAKARKAIGLSKRQKAFISVEGNSLRITAVEDLLDLAGSIKTNKKPLTGEEMDNLFGNYLAREAVGDKVHAKNNR